MSGSQPGLVDQERRALQGEEESKRCSRVAGNMAGSGLTSQGNDWIFVCFLFFFFFSSFSFSLFSLNKESE